MSGNLVSVIVPVHEAQESLEAAVRSALAQTYGNLEVILVDDAGEGAFGTLCDQLAGIDGRILVLHMDNRGVSAARNLGLLKARGEWITFLDADDLLHPRLVGELLDLLTKSGADYAGCGFLRRTSGESMDNCAQGERKETRLLGGGEILAQGLLNPARPDTRIWSKLFRRKALQKNGALLRFREGLTIGEDLLFLAELVEPDTRYVQTAQPLYYYTINPQGVMERPFVPGYMDQLRCWEMAETVIRAKFPELLEDPDGRARLAAQHLIAAVLTASRIAALPAGEQEQYAGEFALCRERIRRYTRVDGARKYLPQGYELKTRLLLHAPALYQRFYHRAKKEAGRRTSSGAGAGTHGD